MFKFKNETFLSNENLLIENIEFYNANITSLSLLLFDFTCTANFFKLLLKLQQFSIGHITNFFVFWLMFNNIQCYTFRQCCLHQTQINWEKMRRQIVYLRRKADFFLKFSRIKEMLERDMQ